MANDEGHDEADPLDLDEVRRRIHALDDRIQQAVLERMRLAREAGRWKREHGLPVRDLAVERKVVQGYADAIEAGDEPRDLGERLARLITRHSVMVQEDLPPLATGEEGSCLLIGGAGQMGRWFDRFLTDLGWRVIIHDRVRPEGDRPFTEDPVATAHEVDLVLISVPPAATGKVLESLRGVPATVADLGSIKAPYADKLKDLARTQPVASVHPMWGPGARILSGRNVVIADCGNRDAVATLEAVFAPTAAKVMHVDLDEHDRLMAQALNLPHLLNLAFGRALAVSGVPRERLEHLGGPTFLKQAQVAAEVAHENWELYRQIQALNPHANDVARALHMAIDEIRANVKDPRGFEAIMRIEAEALGPYRGYEA